MGEAKMEEAPFPLTDVDKWVLSQTDEEYQYHTWDDLKQIIGEPCFNFIPVYHLLLFYDPVLYTLLSSAHHDQPRTTSQSSRGSLRICVGT
jgi:hypothetical protein